MISRERFKDSRVASTCSTRRGHTIVDLAFVDDAVREGKEDAGGREEGDQRQAKPLVGSVALAVVCEGCRQRLVCQH
jgi:hypothetical protein